MLTNCICGASITESEINSHICSDQDFEKLLSDLNPDDAAAIASEMAAERTLLRKSDDLDEVSSLRRDG
jgi:hypothetical protein